MIGLIVSTMLTTLIIYGCWEKPKTYPANLIILSMRDFERGFNEPFYSIPDLSRYACGNLTKSSKGRKFLIKKLADDKYKAIHYYIHHLLNGAL